jgi:hypothetical protein
VSTAATYPSVRDAALAALECDICVFPPKEDGTKAPLGEWKEYQARRSSRDEVLAWYGADGPPRRSGFGALCGRVSGNLEVLEFDAGGEVYERLRARARALGLADLVERVEAGYLERSPTGGIHWPYRCEVVSGNTKLAMRYKRPDEFDGQDAERVREAEAKGRQHRPTKTLIETRGEGGFIVLAPSNGKVHPSGKCYELLRGGFATIAVITAEERELLWNLARSFDATEPAPADPAEERATKPKPEDWPDLVPPWDDYNARARWEDLLPGWSLAFREGETEYWRRPGKGIGHSATINRGGSDRLFVFSTSTEFEALKPYTKFAAYARVEHGGDFKAATRALSEAGFGQYKTWVKANGEWSLETRQNPCPKGVRIARPGEGPPGESAGPGPGTPDGEAPPEPEPWAPLRLGELPPVPDFPLDVFPPDVARLVTEASRAVGCDPGMVAGPVLATAGGLIGRSASLLLGSNWFAGSCLFVGVVALPGDGKSPATEYATGPSDAFEQALAEAFASEKAAYRDALRGARGKGKKGDDHDPPDPPVPHRVRVDDVTLESLFLLLADNPRGLLMVRDELSSLILGLNQYKNGGGNDRPNLLKVWSGKSVAVDRVRNELREPVRIPHPSLSVAGNLPPAMLAEMVSRRGDDGFLDRWLFVYPDRRPKLKSSERRPVSNEAVRRWEDVARALYERPMDLGGTEGSGAVWSMTVGGSGGTHPPRPHVVYPTNAGKAEFDRRHDRHVDEVNAPDFPDHLRGPWSKLEEYAGRLWLVLTLLRHAADPTADRSALPMAGATEAADAWRLVDYFKAHHRRVRAYLEGKGLGGAPEGVRLILRWLRNHPDVEVFPESDLTRDFPLFRDDRAELEDALLWLSQRKAVRPLADPARPKGTRGRKASPRWEVHPELGGRRNRTNRGNEGPDRDAIPPEGSFSDFSEFSDVRGESDRDGEPDREVIES